MPPETEAIKTLLSKLDLNYSLTDEEGELLFNLAKSCTGKGVIIEIGSAKGRSTIWLAKGSKAGKKIKVYAIDPHVYSDTNKKIVEDLTYHLPIFKQNIKKAKVDDVVIHIVKTSEDAAKSWNKKPIELLWIDGCHAYPFVSLDYKLWAPYLVEGGVIAFDDSKMMSVVKVIAKNICFSGKFKIINITVDLTTAKKSAHISPKDKLKNYFAAFFLISKAALYIIVNKLSFPQPIRNILKKIMFSLQKLF